MGLSGRHQIILSWSQQKHCHNLLASLLVVFSFLPLAMASVESFSKTSIPAKALVAKVNWQKDEKRILVPAKVEAKIQTLVTADIEGYVVQIEKKLGAAVKQGEIVLYLENKDPGFTFAKVPVRAPINGVLSVLPISQMLKVNRGDKLFTVVNPNSLHLMTEISSNDVQTLKIGTLGIFNWNGQEYPVRLTAISPLVDVRTGTATAELDFVKPSNLPVIGTVSQIRFGIERGQVLTVPESSLTYQEGKPFVHVLSEQNQVIKKEVQLGEMRDGFYVVKSGLQGGERFIVRTTRPLKDGETPEIEESTPKTQ